MISEYDRGLAYGDGLFETIASIHGQLHNWTLHWQRLIDGAKRLQLDVPDENTVLAQINTHKDYRNHNCVIKLIVTRGEGGRGYQFPQKQKCTLSISIHRWPERALKDYYSGIDVCICHTCLAQQPALAGIKHLNRLEQVLARNEINDEQFQEGLVLACECVANRPFNATQQSASLVIEATSSNLFFVKEGQLLTPKIDTCGVNGTIRQQIINLSMELGIDIQQIPVCLHDLNEASEIFLTNSIFGIVPIRSITFDTQTHWNFIGQQENTGLLVTQLAQHINKTIERPETLLCV